MDHKALIPQKVPGEQDILRNRLPVGLLQSRLKILKLNELVFPESLAKDLKYVKFPIRVNNLMVIINNSYAIEKYLQHFIGKRQSNNLSLRKEGLRDSASNAINLYMLFSKDLPISGNNNLDH